MELNRKRISNQQKYVILQEHTEKGFSISELAKIYDIHPMTIYSWKYKMNDKPKEEQDLAEIVKELQELKSQNKKLTNALGELTLDNQCLKDLNQFLKKKYQNHLLEQQKTSSGKTKKSTKK
jgi:transposase-like protein